MKTTLLAAAIVSVALLADLGFSQPAPAAVPPGAVPLLCHKAKLQATARFTSCLYRKRGRAVVAGGEPNVQRCVDKLGSTFTRIETKYGGNCHVVGDAGAVRVQAARGFLDVDALLANDSGCMTAVPPTCSIDPEVCPTYYDCRPNVFLLTTVGIDNCFCRTPPGLD